MATQTTTNEEELLIITDDGESQNDILQIDIQQDEHSLGDDLISFEDDDAPVEKKEEDIASDLEATKTEMQESEMVFESDDESELSLDFDLGEGSDELTVEEMLLDKDDARDDLESSLELSEETDLDEGSMVDGNDVNTILSATIAKLVQREEQIESAKKETIAQIEELNNEIKGLQESVQEKNEQVEGYDKEAAKIQENISGLEDMKMAA